MSNLYEYIKMAVHNIMANKGRSFLTMLGIIIGIASVIAIVSVGEGTKTVKLMISAAGRLPSVSAMRHRQMRSGSLRMMWKQSGR